jgi:bifunctional DNA-binding transcriptional regulator/antitoxin component of YhaV-PrlF toxin-antitoxin module
MNISTTVSCQSDAGQNDVQSILRKKGQLTLPLDVRDILNLNVGDRVSFVINENKKIEVMKQESLVARTAGVLKSLKPPFSAKELRIKAEDSIAQEAVQRGK